MIEDDCANNGISTPPSPMRRSPRTISKPGIRIWFDSRVSEFGDSVGLSGDGQLQTFSCLISSGATMGSGGSCSSSLGHSLNSALRTSDAASTATTQNHYEEARQEDD
ncbi:hypothetical protein DVH24_006050 [Malus domestica]|uniref:Uncharacterized protein n=1 Tax=Malus domestica TaxID=3750 RepID=A0A498J5D0_MALDO|nr:hypothetical protein DVH24_006050 [Malus domestica]